MMNPDDKQHGDAAAGRMEGSEEEGAPMINPDDKEQLDAAAGRIGTRFEGFENKYYNVTDTGCQVCMVLTCPFHCLPVIPGLMGSKTVVLEEEEAVLDTNCEPFCTVITRRPYGELGSVDKHNCLCCTGVASGLSNRMPIYVGWGRDVEKVDEIVGELKRRMKARGDTGQNARTEEALHEIQELRTEMGELKEDVPQGASIERF
jgi:NAD-dependent dihydropyrimidine dehydrogenase PreA subunit